jgi:hypothetical protein
LLDSNRGLNIAGESFFKPLLQATKVSCSAIPMEKNECRSKRDSNQENVTKLFPRKEDWGLGRRAVQKMAKAGKGI